jgi:hypothetical protein
MSNPDFPSICDELVRNRSITSQARDEMVKNYEEFESRKDEIIGQYNGYAVAVLDGQVYAAPSSTELASQMSGIAGNKYAYTIKLGL